MQQYVNITTSLETQTKLFRSNQRFKDYIVCNLSCDSNRFMVIFNAFVIIAQNLSFMTLHSCLKSVFMCMQEGSTQATLWSTNRSHALFRNVSWQHPFHI